MNAFSLYIRNIDKSNILYEMLLFVARVTGLLSDTIIYIRSPKEWIFFDYTIVLQNSYISYFSSIFRKNIRKSDLYI